MAEVFRDQILDGRLLGIGLHAVPHAQLQVEHEVVAAVPLVDGLAKLCGSLCVKEAVSVYFLNVSHRL